MASEHSHLQQDKANNNLSTSILLKACDSVQQEPLPNGTCPSFYSRNLWYNLICCTGICKDFLNPKYKTRCSSKYVSQSMHSTKRYVLGIVSIFWLRFDDTEPKGRTLDPSFSAFFSVEPAILTALTWLTFAKD